MIDRLFLNTFFTHFHFVVYSDSLHIQLCKCFFCHIFSPVNMSEVLIIIVEIFRIFYLQLYPIIQSVVTFNGLRNDFNRLYFSELDNFAQQDISIIQEKNFLLSILAVPHKGKVRDLKPSSRF